MVCKWLEKALKDLKAVELLLSVDPDMAAFHSQQAAEKSLKSLLIVHNIQPPRTHHIEALLNMLSKLGIDVSEIEEASLLTSYAVETRYPDFEEISVEEAEYSLTLAKNVVNFVVKQLKEKGIECNG